MKMMSRLLLAMVLVMGMAASAAAMHRTSIDPEAMEQNGATAIADSAQFDEHADYLLQRGLTKACSDEGLAEYYRGNNAKAVANFTRCIDSGLVSDRVYFFRGRAYTEMGETDRALKDFTRSIELNPRSSESLSNRALLFQQKGDFKAAERDVAAVLNLGDNAKAMAAVLRVRGKIYQQAGKSDLARLSFERAAKIDPALGWFRIWNNYLNPQQARHLGMLALLVLPALLIFRISLPAPNKRR